MNQMLTDTDKILLFREEARKLGITILPPDINRSSAFFKVEKLPDGTKAVRYALAALKNVGLDAMLELEKNRKEAKKFNSLTEFLNKVSPQVINKRQVESLALSGAFDEIHPNRRQIAEEAQMICKFSQAANEEKQTAQVSLFGGATGVSTGREIKLANVEDWNERERTFKEFEAIGFYLDNHPVKTYLKILPHEVFTLVKDLEDKIPISEAPQINPDTGRKIFQQGIRTVMIGVASRVVHRSRAGRRFAYFNLSDPTGMIEINIFEESLINKCRDMLESSEALVVTLDARRDEGGMRLIANDIIYASEYFTKQNMVAEIEVEEKDMKDINIDLLKDNSAEPNEFGKISIVLNVTTNAGAKVKIKLPGNVLLNSKFLSANDNVEIRTYSLARGG